jgi:hypothetical protein
MKMRTDIITTQPQRRTEGIFALVRAAKRRRPNRRERALSAIRDYATPRTIAVAGVGLVAVAGLAYAGRRLLWRGVALTAGAVEEVADAVEDAAEDIGDAARARAGGRESAGD